MYYIAVVLCLVAAVKAEFALDEAGKKCAAESKISEEDLKKFCSGKVVPEGVPEVEHFFECRYGADYDSYNSKSMNVESTYTDITAYYETFIKDHDQALALTKRIAHICNSKATGDTRGQKMVSAGNCLIRSLELYLALSNALSGSTY